METWEEIRSRLEAAGASEQTTEALRRATAWARHARRVRVARETAMEAARGERAVAALLLAIELNGAGGPGGLGGAGCATERMPFASVWGKGRRHASDGAAWDAAAREALRGLARPADVGWARVPGLPNEIGPVHDVGLNPARVLELSRGETVPQHFALAIARASLLGLIEAEAEDRPAVLDIGEGQAPLLVEVAGTEAEWASVCAMIEASPAE